MYWVADPRNPYQNGMEVIENFHWIMLGAAIFSSYEQSKSLMTDAHIDNWGRLPDGTLSFIDPGGNIQFDYPREWRKCILSLNSLFSSASDFIISHYRFGALQEAGPVSGELMRILRIKHGLHSFRNFKEYAYELNPACTIDENNSEEITRQQLAWMKLRDQYLLGNIVHFDNLNEEIPNWLGKKAEELALTEDEYIAILNYYAYKQLAQTRYVKEYKNPIRSFVIALQNIALIRLKTQQYFKAASIFAICMQQVRYFAPEVNSSNDYLYGILETNYQNMSLHLSPGQKEQMEIVLSLFQDATQADIFHFLWCLDDLEEGSVRRKNAEEALEMLLI